MRDAVIVSAVRTPVGKAPNGALRYVRPDEMAAVVIGEALRRALVRRRAQSQALAALAILTAVIVGFGRWPPRF